MPVRRSTSEVIATTINPSTRTAPIIFSTFLVFAAKFLRLIPSTVDITICPPSRTGIGSRLITPRLMEKKAIQSIKKSPVSCFCAPLSCGLCELINSDWSAEFFDSHRFWSWHRCGFPNAGIHFSCYLVRVAQQPLPHQCGEPVLLREREHQGMAVLPGVKNIMARATIN